MGFPGESSSDDFDKASNEFVQADELVDCLVLVYPREAGSAKGNDGSTYTFIETDVIVLDGKPTSALISEIGPNSPIIQMRFSGGRTVGALKAQMQKPKSELKDPVTGKELGVAIFRPVLGRIDGQPSKQNKRVITCAFGEFSDDDAALARSAVPRYVEHIKSLDPFA